MPSTYLSLHDHIVFATRNREAIIAPLWRPRLHDYLGGTIRGLGGSPEGIGGGADHVHLLASLSIGKAELGRRAWRESELALRRKRKLEKVKIARRLRGETTMMLPWIARRLKMGAWRYVSNCLAHD